MPYEKKVPGPVTHKIPKKFPDETKAAIVELCAALEAKYANDYRFNYRAVGGRRFCKIVFDSGVQTFVHTFIDEMGTVWKSASWKQPETNYSLKTTTESVPQ